ncbi:insulin gene enhancer protein ISL-1-like isoform X2 [Eriocheir sinensis]|uniref:insulin gene enhancer protein ISL-1-like isoform X2 n=1 Tax=Eriocheir sinensis TaxID=95602 RepID=UPI0021C8F7B6|nr:insulin gene enhancer protein ISL-1-like isoform X2 [Eriocheir sinensis]
MATASQVAARDKTHHHQQFAETQPGLVRMEAAVGGGGGVCVDALVTLTKVVSAAGGGRVSVCMGCAAVIHDQYILRVAPDMEWHAACLKCAECHQFLDETCTCFVRDGKTYCKRDYVRLFGAKCERCGGGFSRTDMVMRARAKIFHLDCFRSCGKQLMPGDEFALRDDVLFCRHDYDAIKEEARDDDLTDDNHNTDPACPVQLAEEPEPAGGQPGTRGSGGGTLGTAERPERGPASGTPTGTPASGGGGGGALGLGRRESAGRVHKSEGKPTRVRTVLTEKQLHTLRTCYAANPRPDALMKEQLVEMTGLSPRVIRVWFQNKRCKDKKKAIFLKQAAQHHEKSGRFGAYGVMQGIPLVASPPVHSDAPPPPLDVTAYQPPWKSLTEFALTHDLERLDPTTPQYQHMLQQMHGYGLEAEAGLAAHLHLPQYMEEGGGGAGGGLGHPPYAHPPSNPSSQYPGTPSELSSTSSD